MGKQRGKKPTNAELSVLEVLWDGGPSTVRQIHKVLTQDRDILYTTVLKTMQNMTGKGLVSCDSSRRAYVYTPRIRKEDTRRAAVGEVMDRLFGGSAGDLVMHALTKHDTTPEEIKKVRKVMDEIGEDRR